MTYANSGKAPIPLDLTEEQLSASLESIEFVFPIYRQSLESPRVKLVPFIPSKHGALYWSNVSAPENANLFRYYPFLFPTYKSFLAFLYAAGPQFQLFAVIDKTRPDATHPDLGGGFAGVMGITNASIQNLSAEIGFVVIFPNFQRTHVAKEAVGILMCHCFDSPSASRPGLGLLRVQWTAHPKNEASIRLAERMGMKREGTLRWHCVLPEELTPWNEERKRGNDPRRGRDTVLLAAYWDDWESGIHEKVHALVNRII